MPALACPKCVSQIPVSASDAGQQVRCPAGQASFRMKGKESSPPTQPAPAGVPPADDGYGLAASADLRPGPATRVMERAALPSSPLPTLQSKPKSPDALPGYVIPLAIGGVLLSLGMLVTIAVVAYSFLGGG